MSTDQPAMPVLGKNVRQCLGCCLVARPPFGMVGWHVFVDDATGCKVVLCGGCFQRAFPLAPAEVMP